MTNGSIEAIEKLPSDIECKKLCQDEFKTNELYIVIDCFIYLKFIAAPLQQCATHGHK